MADQSKTDDNKKTTEPLRPNMTTQKTESDDPKAAVASTDEVPADAKSATVLDVPVDGRDYRVEGNDVRGYVGVSPEYMTYASETHAPLMTEAEEADYDERQRKVRVANGEEEPADDDIVFVDGEPVRYGDFKAAESDKK